MERFGIGMEGGAQQCSALHEVVHTVEKTLKLVRLHGEMVDVIITDLAKYFNVVAKNDHQVVGSRIGLGTMDHQSAHKEGYMYTMPLGPLQSKLL